MRMRPPSINRTSLQTRRTAGSVDMAAPTNTTTTTTPPTKTVGTRSTNGRYANTTLFLCGKQRKQPTHACHDRDTHEGVKKHKRSKDRNREQGRGDQIEVRIVRPEMLDAAAQHHQQEPTQRHQQDPTQHESTDRAIRQPSAQEQVDHRSDETTEDNEANRASDRDLTDDLIGFGDLTLGVVASRRSPQSHSQSTAGARSEEPANHASNQADVSAGPNDTIATLQRLDVRYTMAVRTNNGAVSNVIAGIAEDEWIDIDYTPDGQAQVAECVYNNRRLVVRRTRLTDTRQAKLWPDWRHFGFLTDLDRDSHDTVTVDKFHRQHAVVELAIRDLKEGAGMEHVPSGNFSANSAWLQCAVLAHNLIRWTATINEPAPTSQLIVARTVRTQLIAFPGRLVNHAGTMNLRGQSQFFSKRFLVFPLHREGPNKY